MLFPFTLILFWIVLGCLYGKLDPDFDEWFHHLMLKKQKPTQTDKIAQSSAMEEETNRELLKFAIAIHHFDSFEIN
ncbi:hypothetical protein llap_7962 [Limosa lapponica baueri]|uniref:Uncharacterized protein n=1 Tax=Limosa lapponica baueri TaxID=1758121 RepID=A0A2I0U6L7_LIMLA|nr:hypothetical protein llap_7962 [Limosa lapponica baueri]